MEIIFYKARFCPRCRYAETFLRQTINTIPGAKLEVVDLFKSPKRLRDAGIRMVPAIHANGQTLSGIWLTRSAILKFIKSAEEANPSSKNTDS